jgi:hypothetical protein
LAEGRDRWRAVVNTVMNIRFPLTAVNFSTVTAERQLWRTLLPGPLTAAGQLGQRCAVINWTGLSTTVLLLELYYEAATELLSYVVVLLGTDYGTVSL